MIMDYYLERVFKNFKSLMKDDEMSALSFFNSSTLAFSEKEISVFLLKKCINEDNIPLVKALGIELEKNIIHVFHPVLGMNSLHEDGKNYYHAATISTNDIDIFYMKCQNDFNKEYRMFNVRSTSVGDIVMIDKKYYMIKPIGVKQVEINKHFEILQAQKI